MNRPFGYAARVIAEEQQELFTAAEHANMAGHVAEFIRDVPSSCSGAWAWRAGPEQYQLIGHVTECAWHTGAPGRMP